MITAASLHSDDYRASPEPIWEALRTDHPLFYDDIADLWLLTRYADVAAVFADHETYSAATYEQSTGRVLGPTLISRDDYGHVVRRSIVAPDFVGKRLQKSLPMVESCARDLIDRFVSDGEFDLISQFSARLPVDVISAMLGLEGDGDLFRQWVTQMIQGLGPDPERREQGKQAHAAFCAHIAPALQGVNNPERMDHIAKIARAEIDGHRLDDDEVTAFCGLLFIAGGETTDKAIANMWWNLWQQPDLYQQVVADPALWDNAFSETMRRTPAVISEDRFTTKPVEWHGAEIPAGARVRVSIGAANLDPTVFHDPLHFDLHRADLHLHKELRSGVSPDPDRSGHLGFGLGKHFCIGYELARAEAVIGSRQLVERCPNLRPAARPASAPALRPQIEGNAFQALPAFPMVFTPQ